MKNSRIVLKAPFMLYPAGTVFELGEPAGVSGWEADERLRERLSFSDKRTFHLPDMGRGRAVELPENMTLPCPPEVFENVDLCAGPCRVTDSGCGAGEVLLADINEVPKQGLRIPVPAGGPFPARVSVEDRMLERSVLEMPVGPGDHSDGYLQLDFSVLNPGFYLLTLHFPDKGSCTIRFIKSFPLLVLFENAWKYQVQKTLY